MPLTHVRGIFCKKQKKYTNICSIQNIFVILQREMKNYINHFKKFPKM